MTKVERLKRLKKNTINVNKQDALYNGFNNRVFSKTFCKHSTQDRTQYLYQSNVKKNRRGVVKIINPVTME